MKEVIKEILPDPLWNFLKRLSYGMKAMRYRSFGRPPWSGETSKARSRRQEEGFFENFCQGHGLDIGFGGDPLTTGCEGWDYEDGDAQYLHTLENETYDYVYSSHTLEHMADVNIALANWWRVLKSPGYLILYIPHRDLYEKKKTLPSRWNSDHKHFFLPDRDEAPDTIGVVPLIARTLPNSEIVYVKECSAGHLINDPHRQSDGEFSIEAVIKKRTQ